MVGERSRNNSQELPEQAGSNGSEDAAGSVIHESGVIRKAELPSDEILTRAEIAQLLRCSEPHVTALIERDGLPAFRLGKLWRFRRSEVFAWCERRTNAKSER